MDWFSLTLLSQIFLVSYYFLSKRLLNQADIDPRLYGACLQLTTGLIGLPFALVQGFYFEFSIHSVFLLSIMALVYTIGPSLYYIGLKHVDLSETTILDSSGVIWAVIFGVILLGESISFLKLLGAGLILLAIALVSFQTQTWRFNLSKYESLLLIAPIFYALGAILDNKLVGFSNATSYLPLSFLSAGSLMFATNLHRLPQVGRQTILHRKFLKVVVVNGLFVFLTYYCIMTAYQGGGEVSRMLPIQQLESVAVPLLGIVFLGERKQVGQKIGGALIATMGVLLLR